MSEQRWSPALAPALMLLGMGLLGLGWGWSAAMPSSTYWGSEQAEEFTAAQTELHGATHNHRGDKDHEKTFAAARERFLRISAELEHAQSARSRTGNYLVALGVLTILGGIGVHLRSRSPD